jgi:hypothetical protein
MRHPRSGTLTSLAIGTALSLGVGPASLRRNPQAQRLRLRPHDGSDGPVGLAGSSLDDAPGDSTDAEQSGNLSTMLLLPSRAEWEPRERDAPSSRPTRSITLRGSSLLEMRNSDNDEEWDHTPEEDGGSDSADPETRLRKVPIRSPIRCTRDARLDRCTPKNNVTLGPVQKRLETAFDSLIPVFGDTPVYVCLPLFTSVLSLKTDVNS